MKTLIANATIVNEGCSFRGALLLQDDIIEDVIEGTVPDNCYYNKLIDAEGCWVMPGVIDTHVHFREPGLEHKADIRSESKAAAAGGVTSFFDMPNNNPPTVSLDALADKWQRAKRDSLVNYAFFFGATNNNAHVFAQLDRTKVPGIKLFMGSSTGNMLVDKKESLRDVFSMADMPVVTHCEDTGIINNNMRHFTELYGEDPDVSFHHLVRDRKACLASSSLAVEMARQEGTQLHIAHISTAEELELLEPCPHNGPLPRITAEAVIPHLCFTDSDYKSKGTLIKCNPAVKSLADRNALRKALTDGRIATVATDHAPHLLNEKQGGCRKAASGMPMVQFSLRYMLQLVSEGVLPIERVPTLMAHNPAVLFGVQDRGFLRPGYKADVVVVRNSQPHVVSASEVLSKCGWSPLEGVALQWQVCHTFCNGQMVYDNGLIDETVKGQQIIFDHDRVR